MLFKKLNTTIISFFAIFGVFFFVHGAQASCSDNGSGTVICTYSGTTDTWTIPSGATSVSVSNLSGAGGGGGGTYNGGNGSNGTSGNKVTGSITGFTAGSTQLQVVVGQGGTSGGGDGQSCDYAGVGGYGNPNGSNGPSGSDAGGAGGRSTISVVGGTVIAAAQAGDGGYDDGTGSYGAHVGSDVISGTSGSIAFSGTSSAGAGGAYGLGNSGGSQYCSSSASAPGGNGTVVITYSTTGGGSDTTAPTVGTFTLGTPTSLTVPISAFTATDNTAVTGYLVNEVSATPSVSDSGWKATAQTSYTFSSSGSKTLYAWAKDAAGNISASKSAVVTVTASSDTIAPTVGTFTLGTPTSLVVPISAFTASDNTAVTGYLVNEVSSTPSVNDSGWSATAPTSYTFSSGGSKTLYAWAKDAAGNISASKSATVTVSGPVNFVTYDSSVMSFTGNNSPVYGNIKWASGIAGSYWSAASNIAGISTSLGNVGSYYYSGTVVDKNGNLYVADTYNNRIQKRTSSGQWSIVATAGYTLSSPNSVAVDSNGNLYVADTNNSRILKQSSDGTWSQFGPNVINVKIAFDGSDNLYVFGSGQLKKISPSGVLSSVSLPASAVGPLTISVDSLGNVYLLDIDDVNYVSTIFKRDASTGTWTTYYTITNYSISIVDIAADSNGNIFWIKAGSSSRSINTLKNSSPVTLVSTATSAAKIAVDPFNQNFFVNDSSGIVKYDSGTSLTVRVRTAPSSALVSASPPAASQNCASGYATTSNGTTCVAVVDVNHYIPYSAFRDPTFSSACTVTNGQALSAISSCVNNGDPYVQYEVNLNTITGTNIPTLSNVSITTLATYQPGWLVSSPFNTANVNNAISNITWNADTTNGPVKFQIRTAPDSGGSPNWAAGSGWCGPNSCDSASNTTPVATNDSYLTSTGNSINAAQKNQAGDQWFEYAAFLDTNDGSKTPTLSSVTTNYAYNQPPVISGVTYHQNQYNEINPKTVNVAYTITNQNNEANFSGTVDPYALLFYQPNSGIILQTAAHGGTGIAQGYTGNITLENSGTPVAPIPSQGWALLVDGNGNGTELVHFSSSTSTSINIDQRGQSFQAPAGGSGSYNTPNVAHSAGTAVYFLATMDTNSASLFHNSFALHNAKYATDHSDTSNQATATFYWDPTKDSALNLVGANLSAMNVMVVANDGNSTGYNNISLASGASPAGSQLLDLYPPTISSVKANSTSNGNYPSGTTIPLTVTFSEPINFDATGGKTITLTLNSGVCTISSSIANSSTKDCSYVVGSSDNTPTTPSVQYLQVSSISTSGIIKDAAGNQESDFSIPAAQNVDQNNSKQILIDTKAPTVSAGSDQTKKTSFTQTATVSDSGSGMDTTTYQWSQISGGTGTGTVNFSSQSNSATNSSVNINVTGTNSDGTYVIQLLAKDKAGNQATSTFTLTWDTTAPSTTDNTDSNWHNQNVTVSFTCSDATSGCDKTYYTYTNDGSTPADPTTSSTQGSSVTFTNSGIYKIKYFSVDKAGNSEGVKTASNQVQLDTVAPTLDHFSTDFPTTILNSQGVMAPITSSNPIAVGAKINVCAVYKVNVTGDNVQSNSVLHVHLGYHNTVSSSDVSLNPSDVTDFPATQVTDMVLTQLDGSNPNQLCGSFTVQGPRKGYDTTPYGLTVQAINPGTENVTNLAGSTQSSSTIPNGKNLYDSRSDLIIDTGTPLLQSFDISQSAGAYKATAPNNQLTINAHYSKNLKAGSSVQIQLNTGSNPQTITLSNLSGSVLSGTYTVADGETAQNLQVASVVSQNVQDFKNNTLSIVGSLVPNNGTTEYDTNVTTAFGSGISNVQNLSGYQIDTTKPSVNFTSDHNVVAGPVKSSNNPLIIHVDETNPNTATFKYVFANAGVDCSSVSSATYDAGTSFASDGTFTIDSENQNTKFICVRATDNAGNVGYQVSANALNIDNTAPTSTIQIDNSLGGGEIQLLSTDDLPKHITNTLQYEKVESTNTSADCDFSALTDSDWQPYSTPQDLSNKDGNVKVCVRLKDEAGNISNDIATVVPETPQTPGIVDNSAAGTYRGLISWNTPQTTWGASRWAKSELYFCNAPIGDSNCSNFAPLYGASDSVDSNYYVHNGITGMTSRYCYIVKFFDTNNDVSASSQAACFVPGTNVQTVDTTPPVVGNLNGMSGYVRDAKFGFTLSEPLLSGQVTVTSTGGAEANGTPHVYTLSADQLKDTNYQVIDINSQSNLVDGTIYKLKFTGSDVAGNPMNFTEITGIHYDTTAPTITNVTPASNASIKNGDVTFKLSETVQAGAKIVFIATAGNEMVGQRHEAVLTAGEAATLTSQTKTIDGLVSGTTYDLRFEGTDLAWNESDLTSVSTGITYDSTLPTISGFSVAPALFSPNNGTTTFSFTSDKTGTYTINVSETGGTKTAVLTGTITNAGQQVSHLWDGKDGLSQIFKDGTHSATVTVSDGSGNSRTSAAIQVTIDTTAPAGTFVINNNDTYTSSQTVTLNSAMDDANGIASMSFSVDSTNGTDGAWSAPENYNASKTITIPAGDGEKTVWARFIDNAGNTATKSDNIILGTSNPTIVKAYSTTPDNFYNAGKPINVTLNFSEPVTSTGAAIITLNSGGSCTINAFSNSGTAACTYIVGQNDETHGGKLAISSITVNGTIQNQAGLSLDTNNLTIASKLEDNSNIVIDTAAPAVDQLTDELQNKQFTKSVNAQDNNGSGIGTYTWTKLAGGPTGGSINFDSPNQSSTIISATKDGDYGVQVAVTDKAGNTTTATFTLHWDGTAPSGTFVINNDDQYTTATNVTLSSNMSDGSGSGIATMSFSNDSTNGIDGTWSDQEPYAASKDWILTDGDGFKTVWARFTDKAGNVAKKSDQIILSTSAPVILKADSTTADGFYKANDNINITLTFSAPVTGSLDLTLNTSATCSTGNINNSGTATCTYKISQGDNTNKLTINSVSGSVHNQLDIPMGEFGIASNLAANKNIVVDTTNPNESFTQDVLQGPVKANDIQIHADDTNLNSTAYAFTTGNCDSSLNFSNPYTTDQTFTITTEDNNGKYICAKADDKAGNTTYQRSAKVLNVVSSAPTGTLAIDRSSQDGKVILTLDPVSKASIDGSGLTAKIQLLDSDAFCSFSNSVTQTTVAGTNTFTLDDPNPTSSTKKACVQLTDQLGNTSDAITALAPETPQNFRIKDNTIQTTYASQLLWQIPTILGSGNFKEAQINSCSVPSTDNDCTPTNKLVTIGDKNVNYYLHNDITNDKWCYRMKFTDTFNDASSWSQTKCFVPGTTVVTPDTQVAIRDIQIGSITKTGATITFRTVDAASNDDPLATRALIEAYTDPTLTNLAATTTIESAYTVDHIIKLTVPTSADPYYLKIKAADSSTNNPTGTTEVSYKDDQTLTFNTLGTLSKINIDLTKQPDVISDTQAVFDFTTDQMANCFIENGDQTGVYDGLPSKEANDSYTISHSIHLASLLPTTTYFYKVTCQGDDKTVVSSAEGTFKTTNQPMSTGTGSDKTAPVISNVAISNITGETATLTWDTDKNANSLVAYELQGTDFMLMAGDYIVNADTAKYTTTHTVNISGLLPASQYAYTVISSDSSGNIAQSSQSTFTTKQPSSLSSIKVQSTALGQATITWTTGNPATSEVDYGLSTTYGQKKQDSTQTKDHSIMLEGLTPGQTYHFMVKGEDSNKNIFASSDMTFQPQAPPKIDNFKIDSVSEHGATVTFTTNVPTSALVTYTNKDNNDDNGGQGKWDMLANHSLELKNLTSGATFSVKVKVVDENGNTTEEDFPSFTTTKDTVPPVIDRVKTDAALTQNDKVQAIISWTTDEMATGQVTYREGKNGEEKTFDVNTSPSFSHVGVITSFKPGTVYYFKVKSSDVAGNDATSTDYALLTPKQKQNIIQIIIGNFTDIFGWAKIGG